MVWADIKLSGKSQSIFHNLTKDEYHNMIKDE